MYGYQQSTTREEPTTGAVTATTADRAFTQPRRNSEATREVTASMDGGWLEAAADSLYGGSEQATDEAGVPMLDQRDNESIAGASGDSQCSPTATTMVILADLGEAFWDVAAERCAEVGLPSGPRSLRKQQPEEIVMRWMQARDWTDVFGKPMIDKVHQNTLAIGKALEEWTDWSGSREVMTGGDERGKLEELERLPTVIGTWLTNGGHTVTLREVQGDGVVIQDPYGARNVTTHLRHGEPASTTAAPPEHRWQNVPHLAEAYAANETRTDWGEANFFTWDEVKTWSIGKWLVREE